MNARSMKTASGSGDRDEGVSRDRAVAERGAGESLGHGLALADRYGPGTAVVGRLEAADADIAVDRRVKESQREDAVDPELAPQVDLCSLHRPRVSAAAPQVFEVEPSVVVPDGHPSR